MENSAHFDTHYFLSKVLTIWMLTLDFMYQYMDSEEILEIQQSLIYVQKMETLKWVELSVISGEVLKM